MRFKPQKMKRARSERRFMARIRDKYLRALAQGAKA